MLLRPLLTPRLRDATCATSPRLIPLSDTPTSHHTILASVDSCCKLLDERRRGLPAAERRKRATATKSLVPSYRQRTWAGCRSAACVCACRLPTVFRHPQRSQRVYPTRNDMDRSGLANDPPRTHSLSAVWALNPLVLRRRVQVPPYQANARICAATFLRLRVRTPLSLLPFVARARTP